MKRITLPQIRKAVKELAAEYPDRKNQKRSLWFRDENGDVVPDCIIGTALVEKFGVKPTLRSDQGMHPGYAENVPYSIKVPPVAQTFYVPDGVELTPNAAALLAIVQTAADGRFRTESIDPTWSQALEIAAKKGASL